MSDTMTMREMATLRRRAEALLERAGAVSYCDRVHFAADGHSYATGRIN